jgi:DNA primase
MDVVALAQFGIGYAVATLGTSTSEEHLRRLFRITPRLVFCFDGDRAGREAAWRALKAVLPFMEEGRQAGFLMLPDGEDPDTLVRSGGAEAFEQRVADAQPLSEYLFAELRGQTDLSSPEGRARLAELAGPLIAKLPEGVYRHLILDRLGGLVNIDTAELAGYLRPEPAAAVASGQHDPSGFDQSGFDPAGHDSYPGHGHAAPSERGPRRQRPRAHPRGAGTLSLEQRVILMLLDNPSFAGCVDDDIVDHLRHGRGSLSHVLVEMLEMARDRPNINGAVYHQHWSGSDDGESLAALAQLNPLLPEELREKEFGAAIVGLQQELVDQRIEELQRLGGGHLHPSERELLRELYAHRMELDRQRRSAES